MRIGAKGGKVGPFSFDGWEVLLFGGVVLIVLSYIIDDAASFLLYIGIALLVVWVVVVFLVNLGIIGTHPKRGSGGASAGDKPER